MPFEHGDIPDKDEVRPHSIGDADSTHEVRTVDIISEALEDAGEIHLYYPNTPVDEDIHLRKDMAYVWPSARDGAGLIYVKDGGVERWLFPEHVLFIERHEEI
jgi:hypothetical protein